MTLDRAADSHARHSHLYRSPGEGAREPGELRKLDGRGRLKVAVRATRAGSRLAACWLEDVCTSSSSRPFASRSEICFTLSPAKTLAHLHGQPHSTFSCSRTVGPLPPSGNASSLRNIQCILLRRPTAHRKPTPPCTSGPAGWLVSFRRAQRRRIYPRRI